MGTFKKYKEVKGKLSLMTLDNNVTMEKFIERVEGRIEGAGLLLLPSVNSIKVINGVKTSPNNKFMENNYTEVGVNFTLVDVETPNEPINTQWFGNAYDKSEEVSFQKALAHARMNCIFYLFNLKIDKNKMSFQNKPADNYKVGANWRTKDTLNPSEHDIKRAYIIGYDHNIMPKQIEDAIAKAYGKESIGELTIREYDELCLKLQVKDGLEKLVNKQ